MSAAPALKHSPAPTAAVSSMAIEVREIDRQLGTLHKATDRTAHAIIDAAERLTALARWIDPDKRDAFQRELESVLEACSFGDLLGQRLANSQAALVRLAERIEALRDARALPPPAPLQPDEKDRLSQDEVDSFFQ